MACADCYSGGIRTDRPDPTGTVTRMHGLDVYVAEPAVEEGGAGGQAAAPQPKGIVVIIPDAFGWDFVNIRQMADNIARKGGFRVYAPDFMKGNSAPLSMIDNMKALKKNATWSDTLAKPYNLFCMVTGFIRFLLANRIGKSLPVVRDWLAALRRNEAARLPVGVAGYCWGGKHVCLLGGEAGPGGNKVDGKPLLDAGFTAHPSMLSLPADIEPLRVPTAFAVGTKDNMMSPAQAEQARAILEAKPEGQRGEVVLYDGYGHGFACRVDLEKEDPEGADRAEDQAVAWFAKCFEGVEY